MLIVYSLNLAQCLHLAINSHFLFNNFQAPDKAKCAFFLLNTYCIYYRKILEYLIFLIWTIESQLLNPFFPNPKNTYIEQFDVSDVYGRKNICD